jgi:hypothetical protein
VKSVGLRQLGKQQIAFSIDVGINTMSDLRCGTAEFHADVVSHDRN